MSYIEETEIVDSHPLFSWQQLSKTDLFIIKFGLEHAEFEVSSLQPSQINSFRLVRINELLSIINKI